MANPSPGSSPADGEKGLYRNFAGIGRQFSNKLYTECTQQKSFWSIFAKKAKYVLLEDNSKTFPSDMGQKNNQLSQDKVGQPSEIKQLHNDTSLLQRKFTAMTSSLSSLGGGIGNAIEESLNKMEAKATGFMASKRGTESGKASNAKEQAASFFYANPSTVSNIFLCKDAFANSLQHRQPFVNKPSKNVSDSDNNLRESSHEQAMTTSVIQ